MTDPSMKGPGLSGTLRLTWVTDQLQHFLQHSQTDDTPGTWTGPTCPATVSAYYRTNRNDG